MRRQARLLLTNPDMLHSGILPNHPQWARFLAGLRWVCLDEMHVYRGVFGSHIANVLRRLRRLCRHYGSDPRFLCTSATIANPAQLAAQLVERPVRLVERSGAPRGEKHVLLLNPPLVDAEKGIRRAATLEAAELAARCIGAGLQTIVFGRSRLTTELLLTYVRAALARAATPAAQTAVLLATYLRMLGDSARSHTATCSDVDLPRLAVASGLAALSSTPAARSL